MQVHRTLHKCYTKSLQEANNLTELKQNYNCGLAMTTEVLWIQRKSYAKWDSSLLKSAILVFKF